MYMIEITALDNGAHRNQTYNGFLPEGWALDRDNLCEKNFPFGEVVAEKVNGIMTVTVWNPLPMPEPEPVEPTTDEPTADELLKILAGVSE